MRARAREGANSHMEVIVRLGGPESRGVARGGARRSGNAAYGKAQSLRQGEGWTLQVLKVRGPSRWQGSKIMTGPGVSSCGESMTGVGGSRVQPMAVFREGGALGA